ncbi:hypothetical protein C0993_008921 [Termitomyces sp. T159_Od127]|nr:hypothetical protein C0993_008921 [Termitomyces sp. T159_Od127]
MSRVALLTSKIALDPRVIAKGFENNGQDVPAPGQVPSLISSNNFINFCLTVPNLPITNGRQITSGSCNPAPIGVIPSTDNMPSAKFTNPKNFATLKANTAFQIEMNIRGMETGFFVNADENYFAAPQQLNAQGQIQGHSHVVIEQLSSLEQATPTDPKKFAFFKGLNSAAVNGRLTADVSAGLPAGVYRLASINTNANHAPAIVPIAQHGSLDDMIYFSVTADGKPIGGISSLATSSTAVSTTVTATSASIGTSTSGFLSALRTASTSKTVSASKPTSTLKTTSTFETISISETTSASVTNTVSTATLAISPSTVASSFAKVSSGAKAFLTSGAASSASINTATFSTVVAFATEKATADAPFKVA